MKTLFILSTVIITLFSLSLKAQAPTFMLDWAGKSGNANIDKATGVAYDAAGNVYTVGYFGGTVDFNPGVGTFTLSAAGGYDAFIQKLDVSGNFVAAYSFGNANNDIINSISVDASGNLYIGGYFTGSDDFDFGAGITALNSGTVQSAFIAKYSSAFSLTWAKMLTGSSAQYINALAVDNSGNVYTTGGIGAGVIDFDPNAATSNFTVTAGGSAFFAHKLSSAGNLVWAKGFNGANGTIGNSITVDNNGDPIIGGKFVTSVDFDPNAGVVTYTTYNSSDDAFVLKLNASGNYQFAFPLGVGSISGNDDDAVHCVKVDNSNNIYVAGRFSRTVDFDPGAATYTIAVTFNSNSAITNQDAFIAKYSNTGAFVWATNLNLTNTGEIDYADGMDVTTSGDVIVASIYSTGSSFATKLSKFSTAGALVYGRAFTNAAGSDVKVNSAGDILMAGNFISATDFDPSQYFFTNLVSSGQDDAFTAKFSECTTPVTSGPLTGAIALCNGSTNTYSISPIVAADSYTWSNTASMVGTSTTNVISLTSGSTATTGTISVTGYNHCGNAPTQTIQVTVTPNTTVNVSSSSAFVCSGSTATITASGTSTYSWSTGATTDSISVAPTTATVYTVTGANGNCTNTKTISIGISSTPTVNTIATNPAFTYSICTGGNVQLMASGSGVTSYSWSNGATTANTVVSPTVTTTYTVIGSNGTCTDSNTITITNNTPIINLSASSNTICAGGTTTLTATGATTYTWNPGSLNGSVVTVSPAGNTTYVVQGTSNGCAGSKTIAIVVGSALSVSITASKNVSCSGAAVTLTANGASSYTWVNNGATTNTTSVIPTVATIYTVNGSSGSCSGTKTISINVANNPSLTAVSNNSLICTGQSANLNVSVSPMGPGMSYTWSTGQTNTNITVSPTVTTTYTVVGFSAMTTCSNSAVVTQSVSQPPTISLMSGNNLICNGEVVSLTASGAATYTWNPGALTGSTIVVSPSVTTDYTVTGISAASCSNTAIITQSVSTCTGVSDHDNLENQLVVYPNPSNGEFKIFGAAKGTYHIINSIGQTVEVIEVKDADQEIKINELSQGIYYIIGKTTKAKIIVTK